MSTANPPSTFILGDRNSRSEADIPVPMALVRTFHGERVALLALAQRMLAGGDAPELAHQHRQGQRAQQAQNQRAHPDPLGFVAPGL